MAYITINGSFATNPLNPAEYHIQIMHPQVTDILVLAECADGTEPYARTTTGWPQAGDRNPKGMLPVTGSLDQLAQEWQCNFLVNRSQWTLFNQLMQAQQNTACTLLDRFAGENDVKLVWLQVDQQYLTPYVMGRWWNLQFRALEDK